MIRNLALVASCCIGMALTEVPCTADSGPMKGVPTSSVKAVSNPKFHVAGKNQMLNSGALPRGMEFDQATLDKLKMPPAAPALGASQGYVTPPPALPPSVSTNCPVIGTGFQGIMDTGSIPADPVLAVGTQSIIQVVNSALTISDFNGGSASTNSLSGMLGIPSGSNGTLYDPWVHYDPYADRFVLMCITNNSARTDGWYVVAVSKDSAPTTAFSSWYVYYLRNDIDFPSTDTNYWGDYDKIALDDTNFYITSNQFSASGYFQYAKIRAYPKNLFYNGQPVSGLEWIDVRDVNNARVFSIQPALTFGSPGTEYLISCSSGSGNSVNVFNIIGDLLYKSSIAVQSWSPPNGARQQGSSTTIDSGDARLLGAVYRDNTLYACHTISTPNFPCAAHCIGINTDRMAKVIDTVIGNPVIDYYYPAITVTGSGNLGVVINFSGPGDTREPARYAGIAVGLLGYNGAISSRLTLLKEGEASYYKTYGGSRNRWGDYNGMCLDPYNDQQVWFNGMYAQSAANQWGTWVGTSQLNVKPPNPHVQVAFDATTNTLSITGDDAGNNLRVIRKGNRLKVEGVDGTLVNDHQSAGFQVPAKPFVSVRLGGGNDWLTLMGLGLQEADIELGDGNDQLWILLSSLVNLNGDGGAGTNTLVTESSKIASEQVVNFVNQPD